MTVKKISWSISTGIKTGTSDSSVGHATDCATRSGLKSERLTDRPASLSTNSKGTYSQSWTQMYSREASVGQLRRDNPRPTCIATQSDGGQDI